VAKKCERCGYESADSMQFCLECGATLPVSTVNAGQQTGGVQPPAANTSPYGKSMETVVQGQGFPPPGGGQSFPPSFPTAQMPPARRGAGKILLILGGVFSLFFLIAAAGGIILFYNWKSQRRVVYDPTPAPSPARSVVQKSPVFSPSASPNLSPGFSPSPDSSPSPATSNVSAKFDRIWVDFDVTENNRSGMRIHVKCWLYNLKGVDTYLAVYFQREDGTFVQTTNTPYKSTKGALALFKALKPAYDETVYDDLQVFMPYDEIKLSSGKYNLKLDADIIYKSGDLIQHLTFYEFQFTKP
jgi:hypothetical protein